MQDFRFYFSYQVAKVQQMVQQQPTVTSIQQIVSSPQQVGQSNHPEGHLFDSLIAITVHLPINLSFLLHPLYFV